VDGGRGGDDRAVEDRVSGLGGSNNGGPKWSGHTDAAAETIRLQLTVAELLL
jgi:hypothetical protein